MNAAPELWYPVLEAPVYWISDRGRLCRYGRILRPCPRKGHPRLTLHVRGRPRHIALARLVAGTFLPPSPSPRHIVGHRNHDPADCRAENLYWTSFGEAIAASPGLPHALGPDRAVSIWEARGTATIAEVAAEYGASRSTVRAIWMGRTWTHATGAPRS